MDLCPRTIFRSILIIQYFSQSCIMAYQDLGCKFFGNCNTLQYINQYQTHIYGIQFAEEEATPWFDRRNSVHSTFDKRLLKLQQDFPIYMSHNVYNSMEPMLNFFQYDFKKYEHIIKNDYELFQEFFEYFESELKGSLQEAFDKSVTLRLLFPNTAQNVFMATVWHDVDLATVNKIRNLSHVPDYFHHGHIAPILRFFSRGRNGYIYINTESGILSAALVYETGFNEDNPYSMLKDSKLKYITMKRKDNKRSLIYVGRPYCSFIQTTAKVQLLNKERQIISRNEGGYPLATLSIDLMPEDGQFFTFVIHKASVLDYQDQIKKVSLEGLQEFMKTPFFEIFSIKIKMSYSQLEDILNRTTIMIRNPTFLNLYQKLITNFKISGLRRKPNQRIDSIFGRNLTKSKIAKYPTLKFNSNVGFQLQYPSLRGSKYSSNPELKIISMGKTDGTDFEFGSSSTLLPETSSQGRKDGEESRQIATTSRNTVLPMTLNPSSKAEPCYKRLKSGITETKEASENILLIPETLGELTQHGSHQNPNQPSLKLSLRPQALSLKDKKIDCSRPLPASQISSGQGSSSQFGSRMGSSRPSTLGSANQVRSGVDNEIGRSGFEKNDDNRSHRNYRHSI